jgi:hypothetical protein
VLLEEERTAREHIAAWTARTRARKVEVFGAGALDSRCSALPASRASKKVQQENT